MHPLIEHQLVQIEKKTANLWEGKVGNNANIANFVCLRNTQKCLVCFLTLFYPNGNSGGF